MKDGLDPGSDDDCKNNNDITGYLDSNVIGKDKSTENAFGKLIVTLNKLDKSRVRYEFDSSFKKTQFLKLGDRKKEGDGDSLKKKWIGGETHIIGQISLEEQDKYIDPLLNGKEEEETGGGGGLKKMFSLSSEKKNEKVEEEEEKVENVFKCEKLGNSSSHCWYDTCLLDEEKFKVQIPLRKEKNIYYTIGDFCSFSCALSYLNEKDILMNENTIFLKKMLFDMKKEITQSDTPILRAPSRELLKKFGGSFEIDEFRNNILIYEDRSCYQTRRTMRIIDPYYPPQGFLHLRKRKKFNKSQVFK